MVFVKVVVVEERTTNASVGRVDDRIGKVRKKKKKKG